MKIILHILIIFSFASSQSSYTNDKFNEHRDNFLSLSYDKFINVLNNEMLEAENSKNDPLAIGIDFWKIRAKYAEGEIEDAFVLYRDLIVEGEKIGTCSDPKYLDKIKCDKEKETWNSFSKNLYHEPFSNDMKACSNSSCICRDFNHEQNNLDFLLPENLVDNFATLWLVVANKEYFDEKSFDHDLKVDLIKKINSSTSVVYGEKTIENDNLSSLKRVKYAILPQIIKFNYTDDMNLIDYLNDKAKENRFNYFNSKFWDSKENRINRGALEDLDFSDPIKIKKIKDGKFIEQFPIQELEDGTSINQEIYSKKIEYFPRISKGGRFNYDDFFNRIYLFSGDDNISRYSFKLDPKKKGGPLSIANIKNKKKNENDFFIYINWDSWIVDDNKDGEKTFTWHLMNLIDDKQFRIEIPKYYFDDYEFRIAGGKYNIIANNELAISGLKIIQSDDRDIKTPLDNFLQKSDLEDISSNVKITNITSGDRLESDLIFIEAAQFEDRPLEITIEKKEEPIIESNILRNLIIGFLGLLIINESL